MPNILDRSRPHVGLGPYQPTNSRGNPAGYDYVWQDGNIFAWSDSNVRYERAWWLNPDGSTVVRSRRIYLEFDPRWLLVAKLFDMLVQVTDAFDNAAGDGGQRFDADDELITLARALIKECRVP